MKFDKISVLESVIKQVGSKYFVVEFVKKNGEIRKMVCQLGVKKFLKSNAPSSTAHISKYLTVYDVANKAYRNINLETIKYFKCGQVELKDIT